jgi:stage 0 sporulation regulatory protein
LYQTEISKYSNRMLDEINLKRELMIKSAEATGFTSKETIDHSQELDKLIYEYQCTFRNNLRRTKPLKNYFPQMLVWPIASLTSEMIYI